MNITSAHISAIVAFSFWGLFPLYWKFFDKVAAWDLFGQRLIWSFITLGLYFLYKKKLFSTLKAIWIKPRTRYMLILSSLFISSNWLIYIYAVSTGKVLEASMGYFLNPLINVFVGWLILKEEIRPTQWPAIILAVFAIVLMAIQTDFAHFPWVAISLALTFGLYGLIRKLVEVGAMEGLIFETFIIIIPILIYWSTLPTTPLSVYRTLPSWKAVLLSLSGVVTCLPLILFAFSARRLRLQTIGFIQYITPSSKFICGILIFNETLSSERLQTFSIIWIALIWYTIESIFFSRKSSKR